MQSRDITKTRLVSRKDGPGQVLFFLWEQHLHENLWSFWASGSDVAI